jgi:hypothetical protein
MGMTRRDQVMASTSGIASVEQRLILLVGMKAPCGIVPQVWRIA